MSEEMKTMEFKDVDLIVVQSGSAANALVMTAFKNGTPMPPIVSVPDINHIQGLVDYEIKRLRKYLDKIANDHMLDAESVVYVARDALNGKPFEE